MSGGITNTLFKATTRVDVDPVLVRVYGEYTEEMIDREAEIERMGTLWKHGFGAQAMGWDCTESEILALGFGRVCKWAFGDVF